jgi:hypothetical protein
MEPNDLDTDAAGILIGDDICDVATAMAASYGPQPSEPRPARTTDRTFTILAIGGLIAFIVWLLWQ